jgi:hypothetical protein
MASEWVQDGYGDAPEQYREHFPEHYAEQCPEHYPEQGYFQDQNVAWGYYENGPIPIAMAGMPMHQIHPQTNQVHI